jgi:hypothetical protein
MTSSHPTPAPCQWLTRLAAALEAKERGGKEKG